ncbi:MAG TPA: protein-L-isoaspartate(D-aspartate) O-methyltransferase [Solirubrobacteraceae bacterium]|nr:protein-L-isoaspartate(D-aspartate) O-methyltransferase [Solirubrobacteraceae bacterium]
MTAESPAETLVRQLRAAVRDERVLQAIAELPRECFVPEDQRASAWDNVALPIGAGQTISQPLVVARMLELLRLNPDDRVLDVGTGSGYHAALLARLAGHVWTIERHAGLSARAEDAVRGLGIENVDFVVGDGCEGVPDQAPFDAVNVAAGAGWPPAQLEAQLAPGGRLVIPVGEESQHLMLVTNTPAGLERTTHDPVRFVPLVRGRAR